MNFLQQKREVILQELELNRQALGLLGVSQNGGQIINVDRLQASSFNIHHNGSFKVEANQFSDGGYAWEIRSNTCSSRVVQTGDHLLVANKQKNGEILMGAPTTKQWTFATNGTGSYECEIAFD